MPLESRRLYLEGLEPCMPQEQRRTDLYVGCIFKKRLVHLDAENPPPGFH